MSHDEYLEVRFAGDAHPEGIRSADLADAIEAFEEFVLRELERADIDVEGEEVIVSLVEVKEGSARLLFRSNRMAQALQRYLVAVAAVRERAFQELDSKAAQNLRKIHKVGKKYNAATELRTHDEEDGLPLASVGPDEEIDLPGPNYIRGPTSLYGEVRRVGGAKPKIWLQTGPDEHVICEVDESLAREVAERLYETIGMLGEATWRADDFTLEHFEVKEILPYRASSAREAFEALAEVSAEDLTKIKDVESYAAYLKGEADAPDEEE